MNAAGSGRRSVTRIFYRALDSCARRFTILLFASRKQNHPTACPTGVANNPNDNSGDHLDDLEIFPGDHSPLSGVHRLAFCAESRGLP